MDYAKVIVHGRMSQDALVQQTQTGRQICRFAVAAHKPYKTDETSFFECIAWETMATNCAKYRKGDWVTVLGDITIEQYKKNDGTVVRIPQITVREMWWDSPETGKEIKKKTSDRVEKDNQKAADVSPADDDEDDDLPF